MSSDIDDCEPDESLSGLGACIEDVVKDLEEELEWYVRMKAEQLNILSIDQDLVSILCKDGYLSPAAYEKQFFKKKQAA